MGLRPADRAGFRGKGLRHQHLSGDRPRGRNLLVAVDVAGALGYADFNRFRNRSGDRFTAEDRIYARENVRGRVVGKERAAQLVEVATHPTCR